MTTLTHPSRRLLQAITLVIASGISGCLFASGDERSHTLPAVQNAKWKTECASCHTLYHPALLPERSWRALMSGLDKHFGENASLDPATQKEIADFLAANAADRSTHRRAQRIAQSIAARDTPLRISDTAYFVRKHGEIGNAVWQRKAIGSKANCVACHPDADKGVFDEHAIRIPR